MVTTTEHSALVLFENLVALSRLHSMGGLYVTPDRIARESGYHVVDVLRVMQDARDLGYVESSRNDTAWRIKDRVVTVISRLEYCDACAYYSNMERRAIADCRLRSGRWAFVCQEHFAAEDCRLGPGWGQMLRTEFTS